jgi:hypothetical protein
MNTMKISTKRLRHMLPFLALYASLPLFIISSNPRRLPLPLLWVPFLLLFAILFTTSRHLLGRKMQGKRLLSLVLMLSLMPVLLLVLASINQLDLRDIIITAGLVVGITWYLNRLDISTTTDSRPH